MREESNTMLRSKLLLASAKQLGQSGSGYTEVNWLSPYTSLTPHFYTLRTFPRVHCIVLQGLKFTEDYICSNTAEQCGGGGRGSLPLRWLPTHSDQSLWYAMSPFSG